MVWSDYFTSMLSSTQWLLLGIVPPVIFALYFLKLRRRPVIVPSTYLWKTTLEEFQVNSLWQKLRQNILLYLQLLLVLFLILACLRPGWKGSTRSLGRTIFLLDTSASMSATDIAPTRLEFARRAIEERLEAMSPGEAAMLVSFSDRARVEQSFTTDTSVLRRKLERIEPTQHQSDIYEALQAAAGLANPGRVQSEAGDVEAAEPIPADVVIFSDGRFPEIPDFSWGNLRPVYVRCGTELAKNVGIVGFAAEPSSDNPGQMIAFVEIHNFTADMQTTELSLTLNGNLIDAVVQSIPANSTATCEFSFDGVPLAELVAEISMQDDFLLDNQAFAVISPPRSVRTLVVTRGNPPLQTFLETAIEQRLADVEFMDPAMLTELEYQKRANKDGFDLVIFDRCAPKELPPAHTLFVGSLPATNDWKELRESVNPKIVDLDATHPLLRLISFGDVTIASTKIIEGPSGSEELFSSVEGPVAVLGNRGIWQDLVLGFSLLDFTPDGSLVSNTDWSIRISFPLFMRNVLEYFGKTDDARSTWFAPGDPVPIVLPDSASSLLIMTPGSSEPQPIFSNELRTVFHDTKQVGIYKLFESEMQTKDPFRKIAVNLFDLNESNIAPKGELETSWSQIAAAPQWESRRIDLWRWLVGVAIALLFAEGYFYVRRTG